MCADGTKELCFEVTALIYTEEVVEGEKVLK